MADHLPDDLRHWPDDPFRLLGVEPPASEQDLKRAYTRLIRRFKPEHHPEEFRRIRAAYESALEQAKWFGFFRAFPTPESVAGEPAAAEPAPQPAPAESVPRAPDAAPAEPSAASSDRELEPPRPIIIDPVEEAWKLAIGNNRVEAYIQLLELDRLHPERPDLPVRLYWLLAVQPELDADRCRHDWLAAALTRSRLSGAILELYRRELECHTAAALQEPYAHLLEVEAAGGNLLLAARQRLEVAGPGRAWAVLDGDLRALSAQSARLDETAWLSYLVSVMGHTCFEQPMPVYQRCIDLLADLRHLELRESWAFDQIEETQQLAQIWKYSRMTPEPVREVVRLAWAAPGEAWKKALVRATAWAAEDPTSALFQMDQATHDPACQQVLSTFQRLLSELPDARTAEYPPGLIRGLMREFVSKHGRGNYQGLRPELIRFLVREAIDPEELVAACAVDSALGPRALIEHVRTDPVLRLVWRTIHAGK
jgi:hypothetical protein